MEGYSHDYEAKECILCTNDHKRVLIFSGLSFFLLGILAACIYVQRGRRISFITSKIWEKKIEIIDTIKHATKIFWSMVQVLSQMDISINLNLGKFQNMFNVLKFFSLNVSHRVGCFYTFSFYEHYIIDCFTPFFFAFLCYLVYLVRIKRLKGNRRGTYHLVVSDDTSAFSSSFGPSLTSSIIDASKNIEKKFEDSIYQKDFNNKAKRNAYNGLIEQIIFITFIYYPSTCANIFTVFICRRFSDEHLLLRSDYSIECWADFSHYAFTLIGTDMLWY